MCFKGENCGIIEKIDTFLLEKKPRRLKHMYRNKISGCFKKEVLQYDINVLGKFKQAKLHKIVFFQELSYLDKDNSAFMAILFITSCNSMMMIHE